MNTYFNGLATNTHFEREKMANIPKPNIIYFKLLYTLLLKFSKYGYVYPTLLFEEVLLDGHPPALLLEKILLYGHPPALLLEEVLLDGHPPGLPLPLETCMIWR